MRLPYASMLIFAAFSAATNCSGQAFIVQGEPAAKHQQRPTPVNDELAEDMEVFSTIVHENVKEAYIGAASAMPISGGEVSPQAIGLLRFLSMPNLTDPVFDHLPGYGISIQLRVPPPRVEAGRQPNQEGAAATRWELTRKRLRGEEPVKNAGVRKCNECHSFQSEHGLAQQEYYRLFGLFSTMPANDGFHDWVYQRPRPKARPTNAALIQSLTETLAENGHHIRGLMPTERVSISLSSWESTHVADPHTADPRSKEPSTDESPDERTGTDDASGTPPAGAGKSHEADAAPRNEDSETTVPRNAVDKFILEKLKEFRLESGADRETLLRRLYVDLAGRLPTSGEVAANLDDGSADAYQRLLDRLLARNEQVAHQSLAGVQAGQQFGQFATRIVKGETASALPSRSRLTVSATAKQLADVASGVLSRLEFTQQVEIRVFSPAK